MSNVIIIEGNIGSGKTTVIEQLAHKLGPSYRFVAEPVKQWTNCRGENLLKLLYDDSKRWGFLFQQYVMLTMCKIQEDAVSAGQPTVIERSLFSARKVFVENLRRTNKLTNAEFVVLDEWYSQLTRDDRLNPAAYIYVRTNPDVCLARVKDRGRVEEKKVDLDFLKSLHELHETWLNPKCRHCSHTASGAKLNVVIINNSGDKTALAAEIERVQGKIFS